MSARGLAIPSRASVRTRPIMAGRLKLTPLEVADGPELWHIVQNSRSHLERWLPWVPFNNTPEASQRFAEACAADWDAGRAVRFGIRHQPGGELLGVVGLDNCVHLHRSCELGYWLRLEAVGRGYMTEAARAAVKYALGHMGMHRIRCAAATDNHPSLNVIARLGFRFEGIARQAEYVAARWVDHAVFSRLVSDADSYNADSGRGD